MKKIYRFDNTALLDDFRYVRAPHTKANVKYKTVDSGFVENCFNPEIEGYDYISLLTNQKYKSGTKMRVRCSFEGGGAPCLVFSNEINGSGEFPEYGLHFEACLYEGGLNVWRIFPNPDGKPWPIKAVKLFGEVWQCDGTEFECSMTIERKKIVITTQGRSFTVEEESFPEEFYLGITSCEGYCRFYEVEIDGVEAL